MQAVVRVSRSRSKHQKVLQVYAGPVKPTAKYGYSVKKGKKYADSEGETT